MGDSAGPVFLGADTVIALHHAQFTDSGLPVAGLRDRGLLESALTAPQNRWLYDEESDIFDLAASYCAHLAQNHPFEDGNKRIGLDAALYFLKLNGIDPVARATNPSNVRLTDELLAGAVYLLVTKKIPEVAFAEILVSLVGFEHVIEILSTQRRHLARAVRKRKFKSADELIAHMTDFLTTTLVKALIERCQKLYVNPKRYDEIVSGIVSALVAEVAPKYQTEFGMVVKEPD